MRQVQGIWNHLFSEWRMFTWRCAGYQGMTEQDKMWSWLSAHFQPFFFQLIARILTFRDRKYHILRFCTKTVLWCVCDFLQQNNFASCNYLWYFETSTPKNKICIEFVKNSLNPMKRRAEIFCHKGIVEVGYMSHQIVWELWGGKFYSWEIQSSLLISLFGSFFMISTIIKSECSLS